MAYKEFELELSPYERGMERGEKMADFVEQEVGSLAEMNGLDLGCGSGGISLAFGKRCKQLICGDLLKDRIRLTRERILKHNMYHLFPVQLDSLEICFPDKTFDFIIMNGLLEWVGTKPGRPSPQYWQLQSLREAHRILKDDGFIYLATENRWYPSHFLRDPHVHKPLLAVLPRPMAEKLSQLIWHKPYRVYMHSYWKLDRLLQKAGFENNRFYFPLFHYHYPYKIVRLDQPTEILQALRNFPRSDVTQDFMYQPKSAEGQKRKLKLNFMKAIVNLRLQKLLAQSFIVICRKQEPHNLANGRSKEFNYEAHQV
ncbi:MAG: class I SAM-dependent methyltransferase [Calditrichaeota bacterium]|nr:MAG: class I SAM-dependent methyltransferase [Calditrichota bacterium]